MASRFLRRLAQAVMLASGVALVAASNAEATRPVRRTTRPTAARGFNLFAGAVNVVMNVNRVQCNINNIGETCVDPNNSPAVGGGFWPKGSPDQYIFNGGLQLAAIMGGTDAANWPWPGDTVGAFFFDPRGDQAHGEGRTNVYNALNPADLVLGVWPSAAMIRDTGLFNSALIGVSSGGTAPADRMTVSQQDTWTRYWDGNTNLSTGRQHPMGILVEQRGLAWNFPAGNQDIVYFLYTFINITSKVRTDYDQLSVRGYLPSDIDEIAAIGTEFQNRVESVYNVAMPDNGVPFTSMYAAFAQDPDEGQAGLNFSTANLPFAIGFVYKADFQEAQWAYPPDIFAAPFAAAPGFEGVKYLKSPINPATSQPFGISMFTNTTNGAPFPDRVGVQALWRLMSGNLLPTDGTCAVPLNQAGTRGFCAAVQTAVDTRFVEASGPFTLAPGASAQIVVAYVHAAPVASIGSWSLTPFITSTAANYMVPGFPLNGKRLLDAAPANCAGVGSVTCDTLRNVDRAIGWVSHADANADGRITQSEVTVVPRSLLGKANVAQAVFDIKFLLPFAPEAPTFFLVPGDNQVTVAWQASTTETLGDPYFAVASAPFLSGSVNPLYDANFRQNDVEGYRIWRGRTEAQMEVVQAFDYAGTVINDKRALFWNASYGNGCAPLLGVTTTCPVTFDTTGFTVSNPIDLNGEIIQVAPGGAVKLADGTIYIVRADTAITGGHSGLPGLRDNGVPFAWTDSDVRTGMRYFYAVTAFDVNSFASGPSSLESPLITKSVTPRAPASNNVPPTVVVGMFADDGTTLLDPTLPMPTINAATGTFSGPIPPGNTAVYGFLASVAEALAPGDYTAKIDSVGAGFVGGIGEGPTFNITFSRPGFTQSLRLPLETSPGSSALPAFSSAATAEDTIALQMPLVPYDTARARLVGIPLSFSATAVMPVRFSTRISSINAMSTGTALSQGRYGVGDQASRYLSHSRWFDESAGVEPPDPTIDFAPSKAHNSGTLTGVDSIWTPTVYRNPISAGGPTNVNVNFRGWVYSQVSWYPADFVVTWAAGGAVTVRDSTHRLNLPFSGGMGSGYGFVSLANIVAAGITAGDLADGNGTASTARLTYHSLYSVDPVCRGTWWGITCALLSQTATLSPLDFNQDGVADGNGIVLIINGEAFFMKMAALPAAGTKWHLRAVGGRGMSATCTPALPSGTAQYLAAPTDCSGYAYQPRNPDRPALAPGLQFKIRVTQAFEIAAASGDLSRIHTVPDPYYVTNPLEITANTKNLRFVNLPDRAIIRIYSTSGILVNVLSHNSLGGGGEQVWNLRNRNNQFVASGVYFYHVETPDGHERIGRFTVVNYAQ